MLSVIYVNSCTPFKEFLVLQHVCVQVFAGLLATTIKPITGAGVVKSIFEIGKM